MNDLPPVTITLKPTAAMMKAVQEADGEPEQWPDMVGSVLDWLSEQIKTGGIPLNRTECGPAGKPLTPGKLVQHRLDYYAPGWVPGKEVAAGVVQLWIGDSPSRDEKWHDDRCGACQKVWGECLCDQEPDDAEPDENPTAPEQGDYVLHPAGPLGGCTAVSVDGRHKETFSPLGDVSADDLAMEWILADMSANGVGTNIWRMDDHGGYLLLTP